MKNHEIIFSLEPPPLPENVTVLYYLLRLCREFTECSEEFSSNKSVTITNLARGSNYAYSVKVGYNSKASFFSLNFQVITDRGESNFSDENMVKTAYNLTEYEKAKEDMFGRFKV